MSEEQKSVMVVATRYQLLVKDTSTVQKAAMKAFDPNGQKKAVSKQKVIFRSYAEAQNEQPNNEYWVIDEEATKKMLEYGEEKRAKKKLKKEAGKVSAEDMIHAIFEKTQGITSKPKEAPNMEVPKDKIPEDITPEFKPTEEAETPNEGFEPEEEGDPSKMEKLYKRMNKADLKSELTKREVEFDDEASNPKLVELLLENDGKEATNEG